VSGQATRTRRREQREATRREILAAADEILRTKPFRELTVDSVMESTGLTRTAFYRHFDDVTALVLALLADIEQDLRAVADHWVAHVGEAFPAPAHAGLAATVDFFRKHGPLIRAINEAAPTDLAIEQGYRRSMDSYVELTARGLDAFLGDERDPAADTRQVARALCLLNEHYLIDQFGSEPYGNPESALATLEAIWTGTALRLRADGPLAAG
jgi:TetR/AcrR family transcriptional regulator, ethionamide resistance regulator